MSIIGLPGSSVRLKETQTIHRCEAYGCIQLACWRLQLDDDEQGAHYQFLCEEHHTVVRAALDEKDTSGLCEWCHNESDILEPIRDPEEGENGPVYQVCKECLPKENSCIIKPRESDIEDTDDVEDSEYYEDE